MFDRMREGRWRGPRGALAAVQSSTLAVLLLTGFALVIAVLVNRTGPLALVSAANSPVSVFLRLRSITLLAGVLLVAAGLVGLTLLLLTSTRSTAARAVHAALVLAALVLLVVLAIICFVARSRGNIVGIRDDLLGSWTAAVSSRAEGPLAAVCRIEAKYDCRGFHDYDCAGCVLGTEPACSPDAGNAGDRCAPCRVPDRDPADGCWDDLYLALRATYLATAVTSILLALTLLALLVATAVLWGRSDKFEAKTIFTTSQIPVSPKLNARCNPRNITSVPKVPPRELPYVR